MIESRNKTELSGRAGGDPELKYTVNGRAVARWRICATALVPQGDGVHKERQDWFTLTAWGDLAEEVANELHKGDEHAVIARLENNSWETDAGEKRHATNIVVKLLQIGDQVLTGKRRAGGSPGQQSRPRPRQPHEPGWDPRHESTAVKPPAESAFDGPPPDADDLPFD